MAGVQPVARSCAVSSRVGAGDYAQIVGRVEEHAADAMLHRDAGARDALPVAAADTHATQPRRQRQHVLFKRGARLIAVDTDAGTAA